MYILQYFSQNEVFGEITQRFVRFLGMQLKKTHHSVFSVFFTKNTFEGAKIQQIP